MGVKPEAHIPGDRQGAGTPRPAGERAGADGPGFVLQAPAVSLPTGGGAIRGIDETFTVNPANGTLSLSVPLPFSPARGGYRPPVGLGYDSGAGNSVVGVGWSLGLGSIRRRTDRRLPTYTDEDVFVVAGAEDLVPGTDWDGTQWTVPGAPYEVRGYRPRVERGFARVELVGDGTQQWWRVTSRDDVTTWYGPDLASRLADPADGSRVLEWLPACSVDGRGNAVVYEYAAEDLAGVPESLADANRRRGLAPFANRHLKRVRYGNRTPVVTDPADPYRPPAVDTEFLFEAVLDYGEHDDGPDPVRDWAPRPDPFSSYRAGFEVRTHRLLRRVLMFHRFDDLDGGRPTLVRSLDLGYGGDEVSHLTSATTRGYARTPAGPYASQALPPMEFDYEPVAWDDTVHRVDAGPTGTDLQHQWIDLYGEGLAGIFSEQPGSWHYRRNLGDVDGRVTLDRARPVAHQPALRGVARGVVQVHDLDADGRRQVVVRTPGLSGFFDLAEPDGWHPFRPFEHQLNLDLTDRQVRALDLVGDGRAHLLVTEQDALVWYRSAGTRGHAPGGRVPKPADEERGPAVVFADSTQSVFLADLSGDGLADIVRVRAGEVCYWPNLGYGRFGARVTMDGAPWLGDGFDARDVRLVDLTGTGAADLVHADAAGVTAWLNVAGARWTAGRRIRAAFRTGPAAALSTSDVRGTGSAALVWSSSLPGDAEAPIRYVDPTGGRKPHLLTGYRTVGKQVTVAYASSTWFRLADERAGRPWRTRLAFPVQCVRRVETRDLVAGTRLATDYRYRHGCYDETEREFRGFGLVEQVDAVDVRDGDRTLPCPPTLRRTWFHTGTAAADGSLLGRYADEHWDAELRRAGFDQPAAEPELPDARLVLGPGAPAGTRLGPAERRQAARACKGLELRTEVFGLDAPADPDDAARRRELTPFVVTTRTSQVTVLQPAAGGRPAVFSTGQSESLTRNYERSPADPRVVHHLAVVVDEVGNVREAAAVAYGRQVEDPALPAAVRAAQRRPLVTYTVSDYTADVADPVHHRRRQPSRETGWELRGLTPAGPLFRVEDFAGAPAATELQPHEDPPPGTLTRRLLHATETRYLDATLDGPRPLHEPDPRGLVHERYELALTPALIQHVHGDRVPPELLAEGGYRERDGGYWVPSGRHAYLAAGEPPGAAAERFFAPVAHVDAFGTRTGITHHADTWLLVSAVDDAAGNRTRVAEFDLRALVPTRTVDPNGNAAAVRLDPLGRVVACALEGKGEGDTLGAPAAGPEAEFLAATRSDELAALGRQLLGPATQRFVHGDFADPPVLATISRERHGADSPVQVGFEYANGSGRVELHKVQAEPGRTADGADTGPLLRWLASGREVRDAKDRLVLQYEPWFAATPAFEPAPAAGVSTVRAYDPVDRLVRVDFPDGTLARTEPGAWRTVEHDRNDTVLESAWYRARIDRTLDAELLAAGRDPAREADAARRTEPHAGTPFVRHLDPLGRPVAEVADAGTELLVTTYERELDGRVRAVVDPRGVRTVSYQRDLRGTLLAYASADGGDRQMFGDVRGEPLRLWDQRGHVVSFRYADPVHRLTEKRVRGNGLDAVFERRVYGTDAGKNLRTRVAVLHDTAGRTENLGYDLRGGLLASTRSFAADHRAVPDWSGPVALDPRAFPSAATYDALGRVVERTVADGSVHRTAYTPANLIASVTVVRAGVATDHLRAVEHDELGRRRRITYGNGVTVECRYDRETFRLLGLTARTAAGIPLQDLHYTYDPAGNITHVEDRQVPTVWFGNQVVTGLSTYRYDPTYRLAEATGREHPGQVDLGPGDDWADAGFRRPVAAGDALAWRNWTQTYDYDRGGNLTRIAHAAGAGSWTREQVYAPDSNRLRSTATGGTVRTLDSDPAHGQLTSLPHLSVLEWGFRDELRAVATQVVNAGTPETTWYVYDGDGKRVRKVTDLAAAPGAEPVRKLERWYLDGVEIAVEYDGLGRPATERRTLHVFDDRQRVALLETEHPPGNPVPTAATARYQLPDHLDSAQLETDETGAVVGYELFHPFGTTAYQATPGTLGPPAKRYRYTGMERDSESGLEYHGARYYAPWLGRWIAPDHHPDTLDGNRYAYVKNNPVLYRDPNGMFEEPVHGALTYRLALAAGFSADEAGQIAIATAGMDHDAATRPGDGVGEMQMQIWRGNTQIYHYPSQEVALGRVTGDIKEGVTDLAEFGRHLHSLQDVGFPDAPGPHNRSSIRLLTPSVLLAGSLLAGLGMLAAMGASAAFAGGGAWVVLGVLAAAVAVALFAAALYAAVFALVAIGTGHPTYRTEHGEWSHFFRHTADRAFADPAANTRELRRIYGYLKQAARARDPHAVANDADADAAISDTVRAADDDAINRLFNTPARDSQGNPAPSYGAFRARARWSDREPDVSLTPTPSNPEGTFHYRRLTPVH